MTIQRFLSLLLATSAGTASVNQSLLHFFSPLQQYAGMAWGSLALFVGISFIMFFAGQTASKSRNKYLFGNVIISFVFLKMLLGLGVILAYKMLLKPETKAFIVPFFVVYFAFTIFETYFMLQLTKSKN